MMYTIADCSVETLFPHAEELMKVPPYDWGINRGGPSGMDTKSEIWSVVDDPCKVPGCKICLVKFLDGSPVAVRYRVTDIKRIPD